MHVIDREKFISTEEELRSLIGYPSELVANKVITHIDHHCRDFISKSPFIVISTSDADGKNDVSPRGDSAGFVQVIDEIYLVIPERLGNKRMDTMRNIISKPEIGLLFLIPGLGETLRINGRAYITKDKSLLQSMAVNGVIPLVGIVVAVEECFLHCAKAFRRSHLWEMTSWLPKKELPSPSRILSDHAKMDGMTDEVIAARLEEGYAKRLY